jgi:hypothetical protein
LKVTAAADWAAEGNAFAANNVYVRTFAVLTVHSEHLFDGILFIIFAEEFATESSYFASVHNRLSCAGSATGIQLSRV